MSINFDVVCGHFVSGFFFGTGLICAVKVMSIIGWGLC